MRKGADVLSKWVGEAERQLRLLFEEARRHQPSIIFFDEIDGLAPVRSSKQASGWVGVEGEGGGEWGWAWRARKVGSGRGAAENSGAV